MKVKYVKYGVGHRVNDTIYLNEKLKEDKELHDAILDHESKHTNKFSFKDMFLDLSNNELRGIKRKYYWFILTHPPAMINFSPFLKVEGKWVIDISLIIFYLILITFSIAMIIVYW